MKRLLLIITTLLVPVWTMAVPTWPQPFAPLARIVIPAATLQAATTGHSYWICANGTLLDAGANDISATTVTPCSYFDISSTSQAQWSLDYGAQTGNIGGKIAVAELWPTIPTPAASVQPYVRDVASHWLVTAGLGSPLQQSVPGESIPLLWQKSAVAGALDSGVIDAEGFESVTVDTGPPQPGGNVGGTLGIVAIREAGSGSPIPSSTLHSQAIGANVSVRTVIGAAGSAANSATNGQTEVFVPGPLRLLQATVTAGAAGTTQYLFVTGVRRQPFRRPKLIAPYIQWVAPGGATPVVPTVATPIYLELWGG